MSNQDELLTKEQRRAYKAERKALKAIAKEEQVRLSNLPPPHVIDETNKPSILCVRFGNRYGREYVERLRNMVSRNLTLPYEFVCLTDDQRPIEGVRSIYQPNAGYLKGWWHKVHMFDPSLHLGNRILYFDLDVVIHNSIDKLLTTNLGSFVGIHDFNRKFFANWSYMNSSVMIWNHREQRHIYDNFKANPKEAQRLQGDQDWIWKLGRAHIKFWPRDWIQSYKWEIRSRDQLVVKNGKRAFRTDDHDIVPHPDCCVTVFHGDPKPQDVRDKFVVENWQ